MMRFCELSFASVCSVEEEYARCEVEMISMDESLQVDSFKKECTMVEIPLMEIPCEVREGDIIVVAHDDKNVIEVCGKSDQERQRRAERLCAIIGE